MSDAPERIWAAPNFHTNGWGIEIEDAPTLPEGTWDLVQDGSPGEAEYILTTASPEAFATLEPVQALIGAVIEEAVGLVRSKGSYYPADERAIVSSLRALRPEALAALAAREAAAERRGWLAGMERAAEKVAGYSGHVRPGLRG